MTGWFMPKIPKVKDIIAPNKSDSEVTALAAEQRKSVIGQPSASWLTGGAGVPQSQLQFGASKLLGGGG